MFKRVNGKESGAYYCFGFRAKGIHDTEIMLRLIPY